MTSRMSTTATYTCAVAATPDETLAEERQRRTKAGATAIATGLLTLAGSLLVLAASRDFPVTRLLDALRSSFGQQTGRGPLANVVLYFDDNIALVAAGRLVPALATALAGVTLVMLYRATKARDPSLGRAALIAVISGSVLTLVAATVGTASLVVNVSDFAGATDQSEDAARDVLSSPFTSAALQLTFLGTAILGIGLLLTARSAMKVGLLTRFMGVLGMIVGALVLIPFLEGSVPFVRIFWFVALGMLFLHRWPGTMPPAWTTGEAHPWPTQQELRERRDAERAERGADGLEAKVRRPRRERAEPPETPAPEPPRTAKPHSSSKKKKRKRR